MAKLVVKQRAKAHGPLVLILEKNIGVFVTKIFRIRQHGTLWKLQKATPHANRSRKFSSFS